MRKLATRRVVPTPEEIQQGATPMNQEEIVELLKDYKKQNPAKYEAKKAALFARFGLAPEAVPEPVPDASDIELEAVAKKVSKNAK